MVAVDADRRVEVAGVRVSVDHLIGGERVPVRHVSRRGGRVHEYKIQ